MATQASSPRSNWGKQNGSRSPLAQARAIWRARVRSIGRYHNQSGLDLQGNDRSLSEMTPPAAACLGLILVLASLCVLPVQAEEPANLETQISQKFLRGVINLSTGWMEIPRQVYEVGQNEGWVTGVLRGPFDGIGMFFARTVAGVVEVATFPVPLPTYQPILSPAYAWEPERPADVTPAEHRETR